MQLSIVSYLDDESTAKVLKIQNELSNITGSVASINSWLPHITIGDGVELNSQNLNDFHHRLRYLAQTTRPFNVALSGFSSMDNRKGGSDEKTTPYVLYADVGVNNSLKELVKNISQATRSVEKWYYMPKPYEPHVTLAFRDLDLEGYQRGLMFLKDKTISVQATISHIALVEKLPNLDKEKLRISFLQEND